jgi:head-tail adaptor
MVPLGNGCSKGFNMIGRMRHRVTIQTRTPGQDALGQPIDTWVNVKTVWAAIRPINAREFYSASGERGEIKDRIIKGSRVFDIAPPVDVDERRRFLLIRAIERGV